jgi:hypothetical protein
MVKISGLYFGLSHALNNLKELAPNNHQLPNFERLGPVFYISL